MRRKSIVLTVLMVLAAFTAMLIAPLAAQASVSGRRNTAIAAGAASLYFLFKGKTVPAIIGGAGTYYAYKQYKEEKDRQDRYYRRYGGGYYPRYHYGR